MGPLSSSNSYNSNIIPIIPSINQNNNNIEDRLEDSSRLRKLKKETVLDSKFICSHEEYNKLKNQIKNYLESTKDFNIAAFLRGEKNNNQEVREKNQHLLTRSKAFIDDLVFKISKEENLSLEDAYKKIIGLLDTYDDRIPKNEAKSTFLLRTAVLLSSQSNGIELQSWVAYTKSGKPEKNIWPFLDNWKNWVPEAQGSMAKFTSSTFAKAKDLSNKHDANIMIFFKGGYGAGKTRLAGELLGDKAGGIVAPDSGKQAVRQSLEKLTHSAAHIQGSQLAYKLFEEMITKIQGTIVYDSSLSNPDDIKNYLDKAKNNKKKVVIYDVARHDMARILSVLKRDVKGIDPRIAPEVIISSAIKDTLTRAKCMQLILDTVLIPGQEAPEYHFFAGDAEGWNIEKVMVLSPNKLDTLHPDIEKRLAYEGIHMEVKNDKKTMVQNLKEDQLKKYYINEFERSVKEIMNDISSNERDILEKVFSTRIFTLDFSKGLITDALSFYEALPQEIKNVLSQKAVIDAFASIKPTTRESFFRTLKPEISYLDLPLKTALIINKSLHEDPWTPTITTTTNAAATTATTAAFTTTVTATTTASTATTTNTNPSTSPPLTTPSNPITDDKTS